MLKVMTWNLENLFRSGAPSGPTSDDVYKAKLEALASTINEQAPDVVAVQEVGDPEALADLVERLDGTWDQRLSRHPGSRGIRVGWLSTRPFIESKDLVGFPPHLRPVQAADGGASEAAMGRGAVVVTVDASPAPVRLLTAHLKSKLLTFPGGRFQPGDEDERARFGAYALYRRAAEAATLRVAVSAALVDQGQDRPLVVAGDLNDTVQAATTQMLLGPPGSEIGTPGFDQRDGGDGQRLWNLAPLMPPGKDYSRVHHGRKELIDHILVSAALVRRVVAVEAVIDEPLPSVSGDPQIRRHEPGSDHAPVVATFDV